MRGEEGGRERRGGEGAQLSREWGRIFCKLDLRVKPHEVGIKFDSLDDDRHIGMVHPT
jgi:hypothetical protein